MRLALVLATAAACVLAQSSCSRHVFEELVAKTSCGDNASILNCLFAGISLEQLGEIEHCYVIGGCSQADAVVGAAWFARESRAKFRHDGERLELKMRKRDDPTTTTTTGGVTTGTACFATKTIQTSVCSTSNGKQVSCTATAIATSSCAPGNLCSTDTASNPVCMRIDNHLGIAGIIIAAVFGSGILAVFISIIAISYRSKSRAKRREAEARALLGGYGKGNKTPVQGHAPQTSEANLPLISGSGPSEYVGQDPVGSGKRAPQLHQGLGALA